MEAAVVAAGKHLSKRFEGWIKTLTPKRRKEIARKAAARWGKANKE